MADGGESVSMAHVRRVAHVRRGHDGPCEERVMTHSHSNPYLIVPSIDTQYIAQTQKKTSAEGFAGEGSKGRIYLLYTGQHYDAVVSAHAEDALPDVSRAPLLSLTPYHDVL